MMSLKSPAFEFSEPIPKANSGEGADVSPALRWSNPPAETKGFALIMDDPDAPVGTWVHWVIYDIPATLTELPPGVPKTEAGPGGSQQGLCWGVDKFERVGYFGPLPPPGRPHRYFFKLYALDKVLGLKPRATKDQVLAAFSGHVIAEATLMGTYQR
ncbi:MAG: YbhB/YbcL family Raf kinase inhibitor-like protein [Elusimicrobiota bacterium]